MPWIVLKLARVIMQMFPDQINTRRYPVMAGNQKSFTHKKRDMNDAVINTVCLSRKTFQQQKKIIVKPLQFGRMPLPLTVIQGQIINSEVLAQEFSFFGLVHSRKIDPDYALR